ncbi:hypothetical protein AKJ37_01560 [candidate division MSBL1 archaeon SCGC-AAA259I09]|uniref:ArnR1-like winged helix-turn-helix domain-containing protein n=1 Tax=candidate division MSBL1 archaeon SCGC-AAA259I09 TaxID=1698267 RepID=A0A133UV54_9EURY|nr:hypothetical protein AKJ37_01560 [candidate division MSBL1 archaeon SCGC-AAA259I09]
MLNMRGELLRNLLVEVYGCLRKREAFRLSDVRPGEMPRNTAWTFLRDLREASALEMVEKGRYAPTERLRREIEDKLR